MGFGAAAGYRPGAAQGMFALFGRQPQAIGQEGFDQDDDLPAGVCPLTGLAQGQGDVMASAALAAAGAVKADVVGGYAVHGVAGAHSVTKAVLRCRSYRHNSVPLRLFMCFCG
ncbi:hypothetical protein D3C77_479900 [compost metagenome]